MEHTISEPRPAVRRVYYLRVTNAILFMNFFLEKICTGVLSEFQLLFMFLIRFRDFMLGVNAEKRIVFL